MRPEDAKKLLGGYATGTLTPAEQEALFAAALEDQDLFDALAREQSLREVLRDPAAKAELLAALDERPRRWWSWRPAAVLAMASLAAIAVLVVRQKAPAPAPTIVAEVKAPVAEAPVTPPVAVDEPAKPQRTPARVVPRTAVKSKAVAAAEEKQGFERQAVVDGVSRGVPSAMSAPAPSPAPVASPLLPRENVAPTQMRAASGAVSVSARDVFFGAPAAAVRLQSVTDMAASRTMAVRYTVLRKEGADFVEADPEALKPDDTVALRFTANTNGFLSIDSAPPIALTAMQPYTTPALDGAEVKVVFSRTPQTSAESSVTTERRARETYVVNTPGASAVAFTVQLKRN